MEKNNIKYVVDVLLGVSFLLATLTGIIKWPGLIRKLGLLNLPFGEINLVHDWSGLLMALLVLVHLILNWKWIVAMTKKIFFCL